MEDACSTERPILVADEWCTFRTKSGEFTSKCSIKENFLDEMKANNRKLHVNKKNPTKSLRYYQDITRTPRSKDIIIGSGQKDDHIFQTSIPNTITYTHEGLGSRIYNCKFTSDGKRILVTSQRGTSFFKFAEDGNVELSSVISCHNINWTITDSDISSDNKFMVHSTLSPNVHMFDLEKANYAGQFNLRTGNQVDEDDDDDDHYGHSWFYSLRIYSLKISQDNTEIIAGCGRIGQGAPIQVYDLERKRVKNSIMAHDEDINSVCYLDRRNSSIVISGSDDGLCKIWDTRILQDNRPVGIFYGHVCGLTCVNSKEDDRYFISNSKDQSIKLWDIRKSSTDKKNVTMHDYDYRYSSVNVASLDRYRSSMKTNDQSVMTFTGHKVHMTLIRCHFSPLYGTGQRYIYSGSYDGNVYIYDTVTGDNIMKLELPKGDSYYSNSVVRDCAWHPYSQNFVSTSFYGEIHKWEYMDLRDGENLTPNRRPSARVISRPLLTSEGDDSDFRRADSDSEEADINDLP